jgi:glyoxylase-like metal-dependent hydrolase (beta-lactamase superfamily II)
VVILLKSWFFARFAPGLFFKDKQGGSIMKISEITTMLEVGEGNGVIYPVLARDWQATVLFDAGFPGQFPLFKAAIEEAGSSVRALDVVAFTHQDLDHIGCAKEIKEANLGVQFAAHVDEIPYIDGRKAPIKLQKREQEALSPEDREAIDKMKNWAKEHAVPVAFAVRDGDTFSQLGGVDAIHVPGHTMGHLCIYLRADKLLIAGDALNLQDGKLQGPNPIHTYDMALATQSLKKLLAYDIDKVVCYHGGLFTGDVRAALEEITAG